MPNSIYFPNRARYLPVATEAEILEFVNKGRAAGAANILDALMPSRPLSSHYCLIANALNFECSVFPGSSSGVIGGLGSDTLTKEHGRLWFMVLPKTMGADRAKTIADALGVPMYRSMIDSAVRLLLLPAHIGNAAEAFDRNLAFENLRDTSFHF